jgi:hypothetical protein
VPGERARGHFGGQPDAALSRAVGRACGGYRRDPGGCIRVRVSSLSRILGRACCAGAEEFGRGATRVGCPEPVWLAELYWLSLFLLAVGSAGDLRLSLAGSRGPERAAGSIVAAARAGGGHETCEPRASTWPSEATAGVLVSAVGALPRGPRPSWSRRRHVLLAGRLRPTDGDARGDPGITKLSKSQVNEVAKDLDVQAEAYDYGT